MRSQFELRLITTLAKKPVLGDVPVDEEQKDPFSPPYVPDLYVAEDTVRDPDDQDDQGESFVVLVRPPYACTRAVLTLGCSSTSTA